MSSPPIPALASASEALAAWHHASADVSSALDRVAACKIAVPSEIGGRVLDDPVAASLRLGLDVRRIAYSRSFRDAHVLRSAHRTLSRFVAAAISNGLSDQDLSRLLAGTQRTVRAELTDLIQRQRSSAAHLRELVYDRS